MNPIQGDHLVVHGRRAGATDRHCEVVEVRGRDGQPPYLVRWEPDGHEGLMFPGPDCELVGAHMREPG